MIALLVAGTGADGSVVQHRGGFVDPGNSLDGRDDLGVPGDYAVDHGSPQSPSYPRAHSDVPDLPDQADPGGDNTADSGGDPQALISGGSFYEPPELPTIDEILTAADDDLLTISLTSPEEPFTSDFAGRGSGGFSYPATVSAIPSPGGALIFGLAGVGVVSRRRRR